MVRTMSRGGLVVDKAQMEKEYLQFLCQGDKLVGMTSSAAS